MMRPSHNGRSGIDERILRMEIAIWGQFGNNGLNQRVAAAEAAAREAMAALNEYKAAQARKEVIRRAAALVIVASVAAAAVGRGDLAWQIIFEIVKALLKH